MEDRSKVEPVEEKEYAGEPSDHPTINVKALIVSVGLSLIFAFGMMYLYFMPKLVSKVDFDTNMGSVVTDINTIKGSVTPLSGLPAQIASLTTSVNSATTELATLRGSVSGYATQGSVTSLQTTVATLQGDLNSLKVNVGGSPELEAEVDKLQASLDSLVGEISALSGRVTGLENNTTSTSTSSSTTTTLASDTLNGVTVIIEPYSYFSGGILNPVFGNIGVETIPMTTNDGGNATATFQLVMENDTGQTIKDVVLALSFGVINSSGNIVTLASATDVSLSSQGLLPQWVNGLRGQQNYLYYRGGSFGVFNFSQQPGDRGYVSTIVFQESAGLDKDTPYYLYPQIKIVSFNKVQ